MPKCESPYCEASNPNIQFYQSYETEEVFCEPCARMRDETLIGFRPLRREAHH